MANPMCDFSASAYEKVTKGNSSKTVAPKNRAVVGSIDISTMVAINPSSTPNSAYLKPIPNRK